MQKSLIKKNLRLPLIFRVTVAVFLLFFLSLSIVGYLILEKQESIIFSQNIKSGKIILNYFASRAKIPLLADDRLRLNGVVKDASSLEGMVYAFVVDRNQMIKTHSSTEELDVNFRGFENVQKKDDHHGIKTTHYIDSSGRNILDLSMSILYNQKVIGDVHLGMSFDEIRKTISLTKSELLGAFWFPGLGLLLSLISVVYFYHLQVREKAGLLLGAIEEMSHGNMEHRIRKIDNNELGDLAQALNKLSENLAEQLGQTQEKLEQYLKYSSLNRIWESPVSKGESYAVRRQVAILFAGVKGFGSYTSKEKPEEVVHSLNKYISIVTGIIIQHGGYVDKILGDAVVGIFGVSLYRENHTQRAVRAAVDLQQALSAGGNDQSQLLSNVCIGISSGIVLSGNIGSHSKVEYSCIGESIKEAYWLNGIGSPGEIILGEGIYSQMEDQVSVEAIEPQNIMGASEPIKSYRFLNLVEEKDEISS